MTRRIIKSCPLCKSSIRGSKELNKHISNEHSVDPETAFIKTYLDGVTPTCACGCGQTLKWYGWNEGFSHKFARGHNPVWSTGQTKETNKSLMKGAKKRSKTVKGQFAAGTRLPWSRGLSKETDARVANNAAIIKSLYARGEVIPWTKGQTKETSDAIKAMAKNVSAKHKDSELRAHLDAQKLLPWETVRQRVLEKAPNFEFISDRNDYKRNNKKNLKLKCNACGFIKTESLTYVDDRCPQCHPFSRPQLEMQRFIEGLGYTPITTKTVIPPLELDIFVEQKAFAIEHNGLWYHCERDENIDKRDRHERKTLLCLDRGIHLLHIFGDEWSQKRQIVEQMILCALGHTNSVDTDAVTIRAINDITRTEFFNRTHIDGDIGNVQAIGCFINDELLACAAFDNNDSVITIKRLSCISGYDALDFIECIVNHIMMSYIHSQIDVLIDTRHTDPAAYETKGFKHYKTIERKFWWSDSKTRFEASKFSAKQANALKLKMIWGCPTYVMQVH